MMFIWWRWREFNPRPILFNILLDHKISPPNAFDQAADSLDQKLIYKVRFIEVNQPDEI